MYDQETLAMYGEETLAMYDQETLAMFDQETLVIIIKLILQDPRFFLMRSNGNHVQLLHIYMVVIFDEWIFNYQLNISSQNFHVVLVIISLYYVGTRHKNKIMQFSYCRLETKDCIIFFRFTTC